MQRHLPTSALGLLAIFLVALACSLPADAQTFRWAFQSDIASLDPMSTGDVSTRNIMHNVLEPLVKVGPGMQLVPGLATSWGPVAPSYATGVCTPSVMKSCAVP